MNSLYLSLSSFSYNEFDFSDFIYIALGCLILFFCILLISYLNGKNKQAVKQPASFEIPDHFIPCEGQHYLRIYKGKKTLSIDKSSYAFSEVRDFKVEKIRTLPEVKKHIYSLRLQMKQDSQPICLHLKESYARELVAFLNKLLKKNFVFPACIEGAIYSSHKSGKETVRTKNNELTWAEEEEYVYLQRQKEKEEEEEEWLLQQQAENEQAEEEWLLRQQEEEEEEEWEYLNRMERDN